MPITNETQRRRAREFTAAILFGDAIAKMRETPMRPRVVKVHSFARPDGFAFGSDADLKNYPVRNIARHNWPNPFSKVLQERKEAQFEATVPITLTPLAPAHASQRCHGAGAPHSVEARP